MKPTAEARVYSTPIEHKTPVSGQGMEKNLASSNFVQREIETLITM